MTATFAGSRTVCSSTLRGYGSVSVALYRRWLRETRRHEDMHGRTAAVGRSTRWGYAEPTTCADTGRRIDRRPPRGRADGPRIRFDGWPIFWTAPETVSHPPATARCSSCRASGAGAQQAVTQRLARLRSERRRGAAARTWGHEGPRPGPLWTAEQIEPLRQILDRDRERIGGARPASCRRLPRRSVGRLRRRGRCCSSCGRNARPCSGRRIGGKVGAGRVDETRPAGHVRMAHRRRQTVVNPTARPTPTQLPLMLVQFPEDSQWVRLGAGAQDTDPGRAVAPRAADLSRAAEPRRRGR